MKPIFTSDRNYRLLVLLMKLNILDWTKENGGVVIYNDENNLATDIFGYKWR